MLGSNARKILVNTGIHAPLFRRDHLRARATCQNLLFLQKVPGLIRGERQKTSIYTKNPGLIRGAC